MTKTKEEEKMKHNLFDNEEEGGDVLSHSEIDAIFTEGKRYGSLRESVIAHGIENIDFLFPGRNFPEQRTKIHSARSNMG